MSFINTYKTCLSYGEHEIIIHVEYEADKSGGYDDEPETYGINLLDIMIEDDDSGELMSTDILKFLPADVTDEIQNDILGNADIEL